MREKNTKADKSQILTATGRKEMEKRKSKNQASHGAGGGEGDFRESPECPEKLVKF